MQDVGSVAKCMLYILTLYSLGMIMIMYTHAYDETPLSLHVSMLYTKNLVEGNLLPIVSYLHGLQYMYL